MVIKDVVLHWLPVGLAFLGAFSVLAKFTPTKADDKIVNGIYKLINMVGLNKPEVKK